MAEQEPKLVSMESATGQLLVSTLLVRGLAEVSRQRIGPEQELSLGKLDRICSEPGERMIPLAEFRSLLAEAVQKTRDPALGLAWGMHAKQASFGLMTPLISYTPTLRHALAVVSQFSALLSDGAQFQLQERTGTARLSCDLPPGMNILEPTLVEMMQAGLVRMFAEFGCTLKHISAVCFEYPRPAYYHAYAQAFGSSARFSRAFTGIEFAAEALDRRHIHSDSELQALIVAQAERSLQRRSQPSGYTQRVLSLLGAAGPAALPEMSAIARRLKVTDRSLRRHLEREGTTYRALTRTLQFKAACAMLRNMDLTLQDVARDLGFSDATAFHRAFQRWSKLTPAEYRYSVFTTPA